MKRKELIERCVKTFAETFLSSIIGLSSTNISIFSVTDIETYIFSFLASSLASVFSLIANTLLEQKEKNNEY